MGRHYDDDDPAWHLAVARRPWGRRGGWGLIAPQIYGPATITTRQVDTAACADTDPELFFDGRNRTKTTAAKRICQRCPIRQQCLTEAMTPSEIDGTYAVGVWGGTTDADRLRLRTQDVPRAAAS